MDAVSGCQIQEKLLRFTVRDLQSLLAQIGLRKTGKKQELTDRILAALNVNKDINPIRKEEIVRCIDCAFRNIKQRKRVIRRQEITPAMAQVTKPIAVKRPDLVTVVQKKEGHRFRCICGSSLPLDPIIQEKCNYNIFQCEACWIWQHAGCVIVSDPVDGQLNMPTRFLCEICRIQRADPFWVSMAYPLLPVKLVPSLVASDGSSPALCVEKSFVLSNLHMKLLRSTEHELQAWSMLMNDKVQFRMHWPLDSDFYINGTKLGVFNRPSSQLLGTNSRDDAPLIKTYCKEGLNKITLAWNDTRSFCFGIRIAKRRKVEQVLNMIRENKVNEESLQDALARVRRCIGGYGTKSGSTDSDFEVVDDCVTVNLRCPISGSRIKVAARFQQCVHIGCFDLYTFVHLNQQARKWQCPICLKNYSLENLIVDPYFTKITSMLSLLDEELTEIEVNLDGSWRLKAKDGLNGSKFPWHSPNDSISDPDLDPNLKLNKINLEVNKPEKYEGSLISFSNGGLSTGKNISETRFVENPTLLVGSGSCSWFQPDPQFNPNFTGNASNLISPPGVVKGGILEDGRYTDLRALCNFNPNQENFSNRGLGGDMSMQGGTHQDDWIPLSLAAGIVHPIPNPVNDSLSTMHSMSAMSSFGVAPKSGILLPNATSNQHSIPDLDMFMNYNIFSRPASPECFHVTDPKFQL